MQAMITGKNSEFLKNSIAILMFNVYNPIIRVVQEDLDFFSIYAWAITHISDHSE